MQRLLTLIPIAVLLAVALVACGAGDDDGGFFETAASSGQSAPAMAMDEADFAESEEMAVEEMADEAMPAAAAVARESGDGGDGAAALQTAERRVISTGFVSVEVEDVPAAAEQVRIAAESLGGFVENSVVRATTSRPSPRSPSGSPRTSSSTRSTASAASARCTARTCARRT